MTKIRLKWKIAALSIDQLVSDRSNRFGFDEVPPVIYEGSSHLLPQHVVFFIGRLIDLMVPDVPEEVEMKMKREHYMAKEALAENQVQPK